MITTDDPTMPTYIVQSDDLFREGLRLLLSGTCFRPHGCAIELDELTEIPRDRTTLFIVGGKQALVCGKIRDRYPLALIVAMADESNPRSLAMALENGANAALFSSVSPSALVSTLRALSDGKLILIDARLWSREMQARSEETASPRLQDRPSPPLQNEAPWEADEPHDEAFVIAGARNPQAHRAGESNKHIARFFSITEPTVKAHAKAILRKIGANNRTQAAIWALNHKLFEDMNGASRDIPAVAAQQRH